MTNEQLILDLYQRNMIKFGDFVLKSGKQNHIYINLREVIAYPSLLKVIAEKIFKLVPLITSQDLLCGVPYSALAIAGYLSTTHDIPMILRRKEAKAYGTKQQIEGVYHPNQRCIVIEDVVTTGASILETVTDLRALGLQVTDTFALIDREQGGKENLAAHQLSLHSVFNLQKIFQVLDDAGKIQPQYRAALGLTT